MTLMNIGSASHPIWVNGASDNVLRNRFGLDWAKHRPGYEDIDNPTFEDIELNELEYDIAPEELLSESTPLLDVSPGLGAAATGAEGITGLSGGATGGLGLTAGAAIVGGIASSLSGGKERPTVTFKHHNFLGPGNEHDSGLEPIDTDDKIARIHDTRYALATHQQDILDADADAIVEFGKDAYDNTNIHSAIGAVGLGIKHVGEKAFGVKYPANLPVSVPDKGKMDEKKDNKNKGRFHALKLNVNNLPYNDETFNRLKDQDRKARIFNQWNIARLTGGFEYVRNPYGFDDSNRLHQLDSGPLLSSLGAGSSKPSPHRRKQLTPSKGLKYIHVKKSTDLRADATPPKKKLFVDLTDDPMASNKRPRVEDHAMGGVEESSGPIGSASSGALSDVSGPITTVMRPKTVTTHEFKTFSKTHIVLANGYATTIQGHPDTTNFANTYLAGTGLLEIPVDRLMLYMNPGELAAIQKRCPGAHAISCEVSIVQRNPRVAFETAASTSSLATLNQNKFGIKAVGLNMNKGLRVTARKYTAFASGEPMVPEATEDASYTDIVQAMYGYDQSNILFNTTIPAEPFYEPLAWPNYLCCWNYGNNGTSATRLNPGWYSLAEHVTMFDMSATTGTEIMKYNYTFKSAPLTKQIDPLDYFMPDQVSPDFSIGSNTHQFGKQDLSVGANANITGANEQKIMLSTITTAAYNNEITLTDLIERHQQTAHVNANIPKGNTVQPSVHIGVKSVPRLSSLNGLIRPDSWTDVQGYYEVHSTLVVSYSNPHHNTHYEDFNVGPEAEKMAVVSTLSTNVPVRYGKYNETF
uniref:VP n=1 Tax=uncultured densovirus TaxID=748192 RepID=A0A7L7YTW1_9VIRU|nr:VP [uncultured densovirus]